MLVSELFIIDIPLESPFTLQSADDIVLVTMYMYWYILFLDQAKATDKGIIGTNV